MWGPALAVSLFVGKSIATGRFLFDDVYLLIGQGTCVHFGADVLLEQGRLFDRAPRRIAGHR